MEQRFEDGQAEGSCEKVSVKEAMEALSFNLINVRKAGGSKGVTSKRLKMYKEERPNKLAKIADYMLKGKLPASCRKNNLLPSTKEGGSRSSGNYRNIKLLKHGMTMIDRILGKSCQTR